MAGYRGSAQRCDVLSWLSDTMCFEISDGWVGILHRLLSVSLSPRYCYDESEGDRRWSGTRSRSLDITAAHLPIRLRVVISKGPAINQQCAMTLPAWCGAPRSLHCALCTAACLACPVLALSVCCMTYYRLALHLRSALPCRAEPRTPCCELVPVVIADHCSAALGT